MTELCAIPTGAGANGQVAGRALALAAVPRLVARAAGSGRAAWPLIKLDFLSALALTAAFSTGIFDSPNPEGYANDATLWKLSGQIIFHAVMTAIILACFAARVAAG